MIVRTLSAEPVTDHKAELGEGPLWDANLEKIVWIDITGRSILTTDPTTGHTDSISTPSDIGAVALVDSGGFVAALDDGVYLGDGISRWAQLAEIEAQDGRTRMNDGKCDPLGSFVAGTMARDLSEGLGGLYRVDGVGRTEQLLAGISVSNGLDWTEDGRTMYHIDTPTRRVVEYPYDVASSALGPPTTAVTVSDRHGLPDGMTLDTEGCLWVALWAGGAVHRYTPTGCLDTIVDVPATNVTSCTFGGRRMDTLYITTASTGLNQAELVAEPAAGALFGVSVGTTGRLPVAFRTKGPVSAT